MKHPVSGQSRFEGTPDPLTGQITSDYALITKEMTPTGSWSMILAGNSSVGTYGAGEFFCNPEKMRLAFEKLRLLNHGNSLPQESLVLIKVTVHENIPTAISLVDCQVSHL